MATDSTKSNAEIAESQPEESPGVAAEPAVAPVPVREPDKLDKKQAENPPFDIKTEFDALEQKITSLSPKQSVPLITFENNLNRARKFLKEEDEKLSALAESLREKLQEILAENQTHQAELMERSKEFISKLEKSIADNPPDAALETWSKIQDSVNNTTGDIKKSLQAMLEPFKAKIAELREWKIAGATEKKKELIEKMQLLLESAKNPGERSKQISKLHREWKTLGRSNQNEELWSQFKQASDKASESCKEYFKQRKHQLTENFQARQSLCDELEEKFKSIKEESPTLSHLNKLLKHADETWKQHAPVDQSKIKPLQKRYYDIVNELRKMRKQMARGSAQIKKDLINRAAALVEDGDQQKARSEAKQLQVEWKNAGPGAYRDDKELWEKFRGLCDQIFASENKQKPPRESGAGNAKNQLQPMLQELEALLSVAEDELRDKRGQYQRIQQDFSGALEQIPGKQRTRYRDQFNGIKRKLDTRFQALPDKKSQALLESVRDCANYLQEFEAVLLEGEKSAARKFDDSHWQELLAKVNPELQQRLSQRVELLQEPSQMEKAESAATESFRELCIAAEIRADVDSPEEDQGKRMELQLSQLKQGFGQANKQQDKAGVFIVRCRVDALCLGPLRQAQREQLQNRLDKSLQRLF